MLTTVASEHLALRKTQRGRACHPAPALSEHSQRPHCTALQLFSQSSGTVYHSSTKLRILSHQQCLRHRGIVCLSPADAFARWKGDVKDGAHWLQFLSMVCLSQGQSRDHLAPVWLRSSWTMRQVHSAQTPEARQPFLVPVRPSGI